MRPADPEPSDDPPRRYVLVESDRFESERDQAVLSRNRLLGPDYAMRWYIHLAQTLADLTDFPGPLSHAKDEGASAMIGRVRSAACCTTARRANALERRSASCSLCCRPTQMSRPKRLKP